MSETLKRKLEIYFPNKQDREAVRLTISEWLIEQQMYNSKITVSELIEQTKFSFGGKPIQ